MKKWIYSLLFLIILNIGVITNVWGESTTTIILEIEESDLEQPEIEKTDYTITFTDTILDIQGSDKVPIGFQYVFPEPELADGYRNLGWSTDKDAVTPSYLPGESYLLTSDVEVYPVRERVYTITFLTNKGNSTDRLKALTIKGVKGDVVQLPKLPKYSGYTSFGWTTKLAGTTVTHKENSSYTIQGDATFYQINGHTVTFYNNKGTSQYKAFKTTTVGNAYVKMPDLDDKTGYKAMGWTTVKGSSKVKFKEGSKVWIKRTVPLYAVYKKVPTYTVRFYTFAGGSEYKSLRIKVNSGTKITLPELPRTLNYKNIGWGTAKRPKASQVVKAGSKVTINSNRNFYIYRKAATTVRFMYHNGSKEYLSFRKDVTESTLILPSMKSPNGYVFLGWSDKPNQTSNPKYQMGQKITPKKGMKLYSVLMKKPMADVSNEKITASKKYDTIFFIGDSRTYHLKLAIKDALGEESDKVQFFCKSGQGLSWLEENETYILDQIKQTEGKKAVIFNLGVNNIFSNTDLKALTNRYALLMDGMAASLETSDCEMFFMSINPVNDKEAITSSYKKLPEKVKYFNYLLKNKLNNYTYINMYNHLINTGFELRDGLHYSDATYRKIYVKTLSIIDSKK